MSFGTTPLSTTSLGTNQFPVSAVYIQGTSGGNLTALQGGPASSADASGNVSAPAAIYVADGSDVTQGTSTDAANANTVIGQLKQIKSNTASVVIGSGTVTANQGGSWTVSGSGNFNDASVGATGSAVPASASYVGGNKSGNLTGLSLDGSGNLNVNVAAGGASGGTSSSFGSAFPSTGTAIGASDGTNMQGLLLESSSNKNLRVGIYSGANEATVTGSNALKVDGSGVTQPVSGTVSITANSAVNVAQIGGTNVVTGGTSGLLAVGGPVASGASNADNPIKAGGVFNTTQPTVTTGQVVDLQASARGALIVATGVDAFATTATQAGGWTVTANAGTNLNTSALALDTSVNGVLVSQGSTTSGEKGPLIQGAVTTNAPSYTTAQTSPLSLDTSGLLRMSLKDTPANTNNLNVALAASSATVTVSGTVTANQGGSNWSVNVAQVAGGATSNAGQTGAMQVGGAIATNNNVSSATNPLLIAGSDYGGTPKVQTLKVDSSGNGQVAVTNTPSVAQSGTWTVQPGNTQNTTAWLVQPVTGTSGGSTPYHSVVSSGTNGTNVKASAGQVYDGVISNTSSSAVYFRFYDTSGTPTVGTTATKRAIQVPGNGTVLFSWTNGLKFTSGIAWGITTLIADNDTTAISSSVSVDFGYT
jgi:hypothetical protein